MNTDLNWSGSKSQPLLTTFHLFPGLKSETEEGQFKPVKPPMSDAEFHNFLDAVGHLVRPEEFRLSVYLGGVEPALRSVVWRHLLNVYPEGLTGKERFEYLKKKSNEYHRLRDDWRQLFSTGRGTEEIKFITNMVKKDVLRTDRSHPFYAGSDDNTNVLSLFNVLVTFALTHPDVSYCQGMSDIASPLLVVQKDEAYAYICLCGLMKRLGANFLLDGLAITVKLQHLALLLQHRDPDFYAYLKKHDAHDMFFCYRWLLLEMKREFPFDDSLHMLEVMWSSLPPDPPEEEISLSNSDYSPARLTCSPISPSLANHAHMYLRMRSLRRQASNNLKAQNQDAGSENDDPLSSVGLAAGDLKKRKPCLPPLAVTPAEEKDIDPKEYLPVEDQATLELQDKSSTIDRSLESPPNSADILKENGAGPLLQRGMRIMVNGSPISPEMVAGISEGEQSMNNVGSNQRESIGSEVEAKSKDECGHSKTSSPSNGEEQEDTLFSQGEDKNRESSQGETPLSNSPSVNSIPPGSPKRPTDIPIKPAYQSKPAQQEPAAAKPAEPAQNVLVSNNNCITERTMDLVELNSCEEAVENPAIDFARMPGALPKLPSPSEFGYGNPFLLFLCLTLLIQQRDHIMRNRMDYNDLAMHFDKLVRRHNVHKVLHQAKSLYAVYLRSQAQAAQQDSSSGSDDVSV